MKNEKNSIWLCIPCHNPTESGWLRLRQYLLSLRESFSIPIDTIIVDDGSTRWVEPPANISSVAQIVRIEKNQGKGSVIKVGLEKMPQSSSVFAFTDFDTPYSIENFMGVCAAVYSGFADICIGDRTFDDGYVSHVRKSRYFSHYFFRFLVRTLIAGGISDTQCGLKAYNAGVAKNILYISKVKGFLFDLEWIYIALHHKLTIKKWPAVLQEHHESSNLRVFGSRQFFIDAWTIFISILTGKYNSKKLHEFAELKRQELVKHFSGGLNP